MILRFSDVVKSYGPVRALDGISFDVDRDEIVAVLGPNGAGKTTALEIALGLRAPDAGTVTLFGDDPTRAAARRRVGVTPQESGFPDELRVREIVAFAAEHYAAPAGVDATLDSFGLRDLAGRRAGSLSGGQSRRLGLALAFVGNPDLVVLDEPTSGLDVESRTRLWDVVRNAAGGRSILFTTHYLEEAQALARRIVVIDRGRIAFDGGPAELRARFGLRRLSYQGTPPGPSVFGAGASVACRDGRVIVSAADTDACVRALIAAGVAFSDIEITRPSLEEAFLSMTGGSRS